MKWVVGIDEVGRGALAGPVTVAAAMLALDARGRVAHALFRALKDSKKLTAARRECWAKEFKGSPDVRFVVARVYPRGIRKIKYLRRRKSRRAERTFAIIKKI